MLRLVECLHLASGCEIYVAIIVASMPAFASFFNGSMPGAVWLTRINSLLIKCKSGASKSDCCTGLSLITGTGASPSKQIQVPSRHSHGKVFLELRETKHFWQSALRSTRIELPSEGATTITLEQGIVQEPAPVYQPVRQESAVPNPGKRPPSILKS